MNKSTHIIVFGNEKGGTGKSTTAMHVIAMLMADARRVAVVDLDVRQKTLSRYIENRRLYAGRHGLDMTVPSVDGDAAALRSGKELDALLERLSLGSDFIVVDCPGHDTEIARAAHAHADTLVTPVNDSFVDVDLLGHVDPDTYEVRRLSVYSEAVWECRKQRALAGRRGLDWVVVRNRASATRSHNKRRVDLALRQLQEKIAFRYLEGLSERAIYRELFPRGLTLLDFGAGGVKRSMTMSHVMARH
ncbi:MAG TPA: division plane positioning ATPase MipZ, partial [Arenicellales bacterium]|nr:division plane positioning ATPase MipZ [Arenicellales bacterium]